jgi:hypothetical protein
MNSDPIPRDHVRDYWRSVIVAEAQQAFGVPSSAMDDFLLANAGVTDVLRDLLNEIDMQNKRDGRTIGQHRYAQRRCTALVLANCHLASAHALKAADAVAACGSWQG